MEGCGGEVKISEKGGKIREKGEDRREWKEREGKGM